MSATAEAVPRGTRQRLEHVDAMRPIKQSAVISTHSLLFFSPLATSLWAQGMLTLTHFSRDAFLFVSACMLAYSYRDSTKIVMSHYWKRRFMAVGLVYLVWTLIYFPIAMAKPTNSFPYYRLSLGSMFSHAGWHSFYVNLFTGYYHLYFLVVLIEFYLIFPFIFGWIRRHPRSHLPIVLISLAWQLLYPDAVRRGWLGFELASKVETRLVISYPLYLLGGLVVAFHLEAFHDWIVRHWRGVLVAAVAAGAVPLAMNYWNAHHHDISVLVAPGTNPFAALTVPFNVGAIILVYLLGVYLVAPARSERTRAITRSGSEAAYGIYVSQMIWILWLHQMAVATGLLARLPWVVTLVAAVVLVYFAGWLLSALCARTPWARGLVGRARVPWSTLWPRRQVAPAMAEADFGEGPLNLTDE